MNKLRYIHTVGYYLDLKRKDVLKYATMWRNLEIILLSEGSQTQNNTYYMIPLHEISRIVKSIETEDRLVVSRDWGGKGGSNCTVGKGVTLDENVLEPGQEVLVKHCE